MDYARCLINRSIASDAASCKMEATLTPLTNCWSRVSGPQEHSFRHDKIICVRELHNILPDRGIRCVPLRQYTDVGIASPAIIHLTVGMISLNRSEERRVGKEWRY